MLTAWAMRSIIFRFYVSRVLVLRLGTSYCLRLISLSLPADPLRLAIVRDMWLTGLEVPQYQLILIRRITHSRVNPLSTWFTYLCKF